jgi:hypothetical protein
MHEKGSEAQITSCLSNERSDGVKWRTNIVQYLAKRGPEMSSFGTDL